MPKHLLICSLSVDRCNTVTISGFLYRKVADTARTRVLLGILDACPVRDANNNSVSGVHACVH